MRDLIKGALIQSANDAADALALSVAPDFPSFARLMNAKAAALGLHDTHFVRPDGLDVPGDVLERRRRDEARAHPDANPLRPRDRERGDGRRSPAAATLHTWDDLLSSFPQTIGVKTGHTTTPAGARSPRRAAAA